MDDDDVNDVNDADDPVVLEIPKRSNTSSGGEGSSKRESLRRNTSVSKILHGFTSLCMMPLPWRKDKACKI